MKVFTRLALASVVTWSAISLGSFFNQAPSHRTVAQVEIADELLISKMATDMCIGLRDGVAPREIGRRTAASMPQHRDQYMRLADAGTLADSVALAAYDKCPDVFEALQ